MTDYNLLAKAEIDKYSRLVYSKYGEMKDDAAKVYAATAIQGRIDALNNFDPTIMTLRVRQQRYDIITHYTTLKQAIQDYKL